MVLGIFQSLFQSGNFWSVSGSLHLSGSITESGEYSVTTEDAKLKLTYNTTDKKWNEKEDGTVTYKDEAKFTDSGSRSYNNSSGTIEARLIFNE
jgi:hypothetical protein